MTEATVLVDQGQGPQLVVVRQEMSFRSHEHGTLLILNQDGTYALLRSIEHFTSAHRGFVTALGRLLEDIEERGYRRGLEAARNDL